MEAAPGREQVTRAHEVVSATDRPAPRSDGGAPSGDASAGRPRAGARCRRQAGRAQGTGLAVNVALDPAAAWAERRARPCDLARAPLERGAGIRTLARPASASRLQDGAVEVSVADDGAGMDPERAARALTEGHIGLASVTQRVEANGGELQIQADARIGHAGLGTPRRLRAAARGRTPRAPEPEAAAEAAPTAEPRRIDDGRRVAWDDHAARVARVRRNRSATAVRIAAVASSAGESAAGSLPEHAQSLAPARARPGPRWRSLGGRRRGSSAGAGAAPRRARLPARARARRCRPCRASRGPQGRPSRWRSARWQRCERAWNPKRCAAPRPLRRSRGPCSPCRRRPWRPARRPPRSRRRRPRGRVRRHRPQPRPRRPRHRRPLPRRRHQRLRRPSFRRLPSRRRFRASTRKRVQARQAGRSAPARRAPCRSGEVRSGSRGSARSPSCGSGRGRTPSGGPRSPRQAPGGPRRRSGGDPGLRRPGTCGPGPEAT